MAPATDIAAKRAAGRQDQPRRNGETAYAAMAS